MCFQFLFEKQYFVTRLSNLELEWVPDSGAWDRKGKRPKVWWRNLGTMVTTSSRQETLSTDGRVNWMEQLHQIPQSCTNTSIDDSTILWVNIIQNIHPCSILTLGLLRRYSTSFSYTYLSRQYSASCSMNARNSCLEKVSSTIFNFSLTENEAEHKKINKWDYRNQ